MIASLIRHIDLATPVFGSPLAVILVLCLLLQLVLTYYIGHPYKIIAALMDVLLVIALLLTLDVV